VGIEDRLDVSFIAHLALKEKQLQQSYRPIVAVHKWFARRPGALFRGLILSEFVDQPLREAYYRPHRLEGYVIVDPFMGGGTTLLEANRLGCDVIGFDINPLSYWVVREALEPIDVEAYSEAAEDLIRFLEEEIGDLYRTSCVRCGGDAEVKYFLWVKTAACPACGKTVDLFPGPFLAVRGRHPRDVVVCRWCGELNEIEERRPFPCRSCGRLPDLRPGARRSQARCPHCGQAFRYPDGSGPPAHRLFALEYYCRRCAPRHPGRFFKRADEADLERYDEAIRRLRELEPRFIPEEEIPPGDETARLRRWGYRRWRDLFNARQLLGLELSARRILEIPQPRLRRALITNFSDLLRYQNMLCRYDPSALKSLDVFSIHGFPVSLIQAESNLLGVTEDGRRIGSGGWRNIVDKYRKAKEYAEAPFEPLPGRPGRRVFLPGERIGVGRDGEMTRRVRLECRDAREANLPPHVADAVLTDPPYFGNIQYAELTEFCYVWLRRLAPEDPVVAVHPTTRRPEELTGNRTLARGLVDFAEGLSVVFRRMALALKPGRPLAFTYHHSQPQGYHPVAAAILDAGMVCTRVFPCPSEMHGSIHIHRSGSSRVDMVFVCRSQGAVHGTDGPDESEAWIEEARRDVKDLERAGMRLREGDLRAIRMGHLTRLVIARLRPGWDPDRPMVEKLDRIGKAFEALGGPEAALEKIIPRRRKD
jgi:putative DNA methylase